MKIFGLTGGIGSGKSTVASLLRDRGIQVVCADDLARAAVAVGSEGLRRVFEAFGSEILCKNGTLNRKRLADAVFRDQVQRKRLESIIHPLVREAYARELARLQREGHELAVYEVPLLFENGLESTLDGVVVVATSEHARLTRIHERDGSSEDQVRARMSSQLNEETKRARADYCIPNDGTLSDLEAAVDRCVEEFLRG